MKNIEVEVKDRKLVLTIDLDKSYGDSKSGKTLIVASSEGNVKVDPNDPQLMLGINVYRKKT